VLAEDGWQSAIHGCKEDMKNKRLDEDKRQDSKEKERLPGRRKCRFLGAKKELQDR
jgi:hypothetical protein